MAAPITTFTGSLQLLFTFNAQQTVTGLSTARKNVNQPTVIADFTATGSTTANAANQCYWNLYTISAGSSTTIDLSAAVTNVVGSETATFARIKAIYIQNLSVAQDATNGGSATSITVGAAATNQFIGQSNSGFFENTTDEITMPLGAFFAWGTHNANGVVVDSTHKSLKILNNDGSNAAKVVVGIIGADA